MFSKRLERGDRAEDMVLSTQCQGLCLDQDIDVGMIGQPARIDWVVFVFPTESVQIEGFNKQR